MRLHRSHRCLNDFSPVTFSVRCAGSKNKTSNQKKKEHYPQVLFRWKYSEHTLAV